VLSSFFAIVALLLAAIGLYGVLHYSVNRQHREIGIRMALGARRSHVLRRIGAEVAWVLLLGSAAGVAAGLLGERFVQTLLYGVSGQEIGTIAAPIFALAAVAFLAALPAAHRAARIDPAQTLRAE
jgi:ABC-type antimicrobial peptide transport system permease subunit